MSALDKITNKVQALAGQATEKYGQATGNKQQQGRGRTPSRLVSTASKPPRRSKDMFKWEGKRVGPTSKAAPAAG